ncbi:anti-sigma factor [Clostridium chromiireducens]|uniref:Anti-sigma factor n=1 Tax=Clostridium chromiireducens TaxID=225345 RepID=A0A964W4A4_9CLOT|nr:anti-sigma factor [Clostridium chromiireducens]MVX66082.1 anti-sigma factor [Clostridium chromiireducens]
MNKGIIMEIKRNYAIALSDEGVMDKIISKQNMRVGQKIFYFDDDIIKTTTSNISRYNSFMKAIGSIAALFLIVFTFFHTIKSETAYAVVSLDINPSIQIEADSNLKIIKVEGVNTDGKNIDFTDMKDMTLDDGIKKIKEKLIEKKYLETNKDVLVGIAFVQNGDNSNYEENLKVAIQSTFSTEDVTLTYVKGDKEAVDEAKTKGISLGRYEASLKVDDETKKKIDVAPVKEITASIKDKDNVTQWDAKDEKDDKLTPVTKPSSDEITEKPSTDRPVINAPSDNKDTNTDANKGSEGNSKPEKNNDVLELDPEVPAQTDKDGTSTPPKKDDVINIEPNNGGVIQNNQTSGKIDESPNTTQLEPSKNQQSVIDKVVK